MQPSKNSHSPDDAPRLRINLAQNRIGWRKYKPLYSKISSIAELGIFFVICCPLLPIAGLLYLLNRFHVYRQKKAVENGVLSSELSIAQKSTVYLDGSDVSGILGTTDIESSQNTKTVRFHYCGGNGRYRVYGTREEGLFLLVPLQSKINPEKSKTSTYYQCDVVGVDGGSNHGYFGEKSPLGSSDCVVLVCKKASRFPPSKDLVLIRTRSVTEALRRGLSRA